MDDVLLNKAAIVERCLARIAEEYVGFEKESPGPSHRLLSAQKADELLGFAVRERKGIVVRVDTALVMPGPGARIAFYLPRSALDLDKEEALRREDE